MDELVVRLLIVGGVISAAVAAAAVGRAKAKRRHPWLDLRGSGLDDRVVVFTSTDCSNCAAAIASLKAAGVSFREVTWELEPARFDALGVAAVPLTVFRDPDGTTVAQIGGVPKSRAVARAVSRTVPR